MQLLLEFFEKRYSFHLKSRSYHRKHVKTYRFHNLLPVVWQDILGSFTGR